MPNLIAHRIFIDQVIAERISSNKLLDALRLGTQGPDPLFYYGLIPWRSWHYLSALKKYGNLIHRTNGEEFFKKLISETQLISNPEEKSVFSAFVFGQIAHLVLDRAAHPYIYYSSGFDENGKLTGSFHYSHAKFESNIDAALAEMYTEYDFRGHTQDLLPYSPEVYRIIDRHLTPVVNSMFNAKLTKHYYSNSIKNIRTMQKLTNVTWLKRVTGKHSMFNALYTPKSIDKDYLNLEHREWKHPTDGTINNYSFLDILEQARKLLDPLFLVFLEKGVDIEMLDIINHDSYKGVPVGAKLSYWTSKKILPD